jgi:murein DD-endopeptidase MepM/ murein hydrolase activator NlpD
MPPGIPALSIGPGKVSISKDITTGGYVKIDHPDGLSSQYMHIKDRKVAVGDEVKAGQPIGEIHYDTRPGGFKLIHLHFQLRHHGRLVNPKAFLDALPILKNPWDVKKTLVTVALAGFVGWGVWRLTR